MERHGLHCGPQWVSRKVCACVCVCVCVCVCGGGVGGDSDSVRFKTTSVLWLPVVSTWFGGSSFHTNEMFSVHFVTMKTCCLSDSSLLIHKNTCHQPSDLVVD